MGAAVNPLEQILKAIAARVRQVVQEELAAPGPAATELVTPREYARDHSIAVSTVRQMIKDGRIEAIKIGKRQWRERRDAPIGQPLLRTRVPRTGTPADRASSDPGGIVMNVWATLLDGAHRDAGGREPSRTAPNAGGGR